MCQRLPTQHADSEYNCKKCTFLNPADQDVCMMCNASQRDDVVAPPPPPRKLGSRTTEAHATSPETGSTSGPNFDVEGKTHAQLQQMFEMSRITARKREQMTNGGDQKMVEADMFGMWICPKCFHRCLPLTNSCEICQTSRFATQDSSEKATKDRLIHMLSHIDDARKEWSGKVAQTLMNDFELIVNGKAFKLLECEVHFFPVPFNHAGEWYFYQIDSGGTQVKFREGFRKGLGVAFMQGGMTGAMMFSAIQGQEPCTCALKQANCPNCNTISVGAASVVGQILATGWWQRKVTTLLENLLADGSLDSVIPNAFLYLRPLPTPSGRTDRKSVV